MGLIVPDVFAKILEITGGDPILSYQNAQYEKNFYGLKIFQRRKVVDSTPRFLYKLYGWDFNGGEDDVKRRKWFEDMMTSNKIRLLSRLDFNDPYDVYPRFDYGYELDDIKLLFDVDFKKQGVNGVRRRKLVDKAICDFIGDNENRISALSQVMRQFYNDFGIFCLTENVREILMWSHYANSHKGFCVAFDQLQDFDFFCYLNRVQYVVDRPFVSIAKRNGFDFDETLLKKAKCWSYEREWRYVSKKKAHDFVELRDGVFKAFILGMNAGNEVFDFLVGVNKNRVAVGLDELPIFVAQMDDSKYSIKFKKHCCECS